MDESIAADPEGKRPGIWLAYLQLFRLPNVFTAIADVVMGYLLVRAGYQLLQDPPQELLGPADTFPLLLLILASSLIYTAGMVLNDVFDYQVDSQERPQRPLPSGRIPLGRARALGLLMLLAGIVAAALSGWGVPDAALRWRGLLVAVALVTAVLLYDGVLKKTVLAPPMMGACRLLNVLLGMSYAGMANVPGGIFLGWEEYQVLVAAGLGVYITGVTWYARSEARESSRPALSAGCLVMIAGLVILAVFFPRSVPKEALLMTAGQAGLFIVVLAATVIYRCAWGVFEPTPKRVQQAVKRCILSIILLDAAITGILCPWYYAVAVLALLVPTLVLGKWLYST